MNPRIWMAGALLAVLGSVHAHEVTYNVVTTWYEPQTQPRNTIFQGSFDFDEHTFTVTNLKGQLSESMTNLGGNTMVWLDLQYQVVPSWHDSNFGGTFAAVFKNNSTNTFWTGGGGDGWTPQAGIDAGGLHYGWPTKALNPGNAYALIFVPDNPTAALTQVQIDMLAYADCTPTAAGGMMMGGGMMGAVCMTGTALAGYGGTGTMDGYPLSQTIVAAPVPEPSVYALMLAGLGLVGALARRSARHG